MEDIKEKTSDEMWKPIKDYEGCYEISNFGRVKSLPRFHRTSKNYSSLGYESKEKILKLTKTDKGYLIVGLYKDGNRKFYKVHRLVAKAFIDNPNNYQIINHIDCNKENNNVNNLEWCTQKHNIKESYRNGLQIAPRGKESTSSKKVKQYNLDGNFIKTWDCLMEIERKLGIANSLISVCCSGKKKTAGGYIWRYADE